MEFNKIVHEYISPLNAVLIIVLNLMEIILLLKTRNGLKVASSLIFVLNLSVSDLIVGILIVFAKIFSFLKKHHYQDSAALKLSLDAAHNMERLSCLLSVFNLLAFTFARMLATRWPLLHRAKFTRKLAIKISCGIWIMSLAILVSYYCVFKFGVSKDVAARFEGLIYPVSTYCATAILIYSYRIIYSELRTRRKGISVYAHENCSAQKDNKEENGGTAEGVSHKKIKGRKQKNEDRIKRIATASVLAFGFCWLPISTIALIESTGVTWSNAGKIRKCFYLLGCWNSIINPILYIVFSHHSADIKRLLCCKTSKPQRQRQRERFQSSAPPTSVTDTDTNLNNITINVT